MARFSVEASPAGGGVVLTLAGELDLAAADDLRTELERQTAGAASVVVDCAGVTFLDSTGLRTLIEAASRAAASGVRFSLAAVPEPINRVLDLAGVADLFVIHADRTQALAD